MKARLWVAQFESEEAARSFSLPKYDVDGEPQCDFWTDIGAEHIDTDFQEVVFSDWRAYLEELGGGSIREVLSRRENTLIIVYERENELSNLAGGNYATFLGEFELEI